MILVGQYDSPFVRRVAVTLNCYGIPFERNTMSVFGDAKAMQAINPLIRIPSLILDDSEVLIDSVAIIDHLDERVGPGHALVPPKGKERRLILQATALAQGAAEKAGQISYERYFHPGQGLNRDWEGRCLGQLAAGLQRLESLCAEQWLFGEKLSHADIMTGCLLGYLHLRVPDAFPDHLYPKLHAFGVRCELHKAFAAARIGANETMPDRN